MSPGAAEIPPSLFEIVRLGEPAAGVVVVEQLLAEGSPGVVVAAQEVFKIELAPDGRGLARVTANDRESDAPGASGPREREQVEPAEAFGEQVHPGELAPALKVVFWGTVSVSATAEAVRLPALLRARL